MFKLPTLPKQVILALVVYPMVNAVLFGIGAVGVLALFESQARELLPIVIVLSFVLAAPIAYLIAPRLSLRLQGKAYPHGPNPVAGQA